MIEIRHITRTLLIMLYNHAQLCDMLTSQYIVLSVVVYGFVSLLYWLNSVDVLFIPLINTHNHHTCEKGWLINDITENLAPCQEMNEFSKSQRCITDSCTMACHKKTGSPIFGFPWSKYIEIFGPPDNLFQFC